MLLAKFLGFTISLRRLKRDLPDYGLNKIKSDISDGSVAHHL